MGVQLATRILKHPSFVASVGCILHATSSFLAPYIRLLRLRLLSIFISAFEFTHRTLLKISLDCITCSPVDTRYCRLRLPD